MKKYSKFLTIILIILTISIIALVVYAIYTLYDNYISDESADDLISDFESNYGDSQQVQTEPEIEEQPQENQDTNTSKPNNSSSGGGSSYTLGTYYKGYKVIGTISIPKLNIKYPIFKDDNSTTLKVGTAAIYPGPATIESALNSPGNVVIAGHNYRNSRMFSKINTLKEGDTIYITNISGIQLEYKVYNNYTVSQDNFDYATRDTNGYPEISLTTCTTDASIRTIVWARANK